MTEDVGYDVGYTLKQAQVALHAAMDAALRPLGLTVSQYACLELLHRTPGQTNAQLARAAFVTPQSMNGVLRDLQRRGLLERPPAAATGRANPARLTDEGRGIVRRARNALKPVLRALGTIAQAPEHAHVLDSLRAIIAGLEASPGENTKTR